MTLNDDEIAALEAGEARTGIFFRLETAPIVRLWLGIGNIEPGVNVYDATGATYIGFGEVQAVPAFRQLINGRAERVSFTLSGVSGEVLKIASGGDADQVKGKRVALGFALMGEDWSLLGPVKWVANYFADYLSIEQAVANVTGEVVRTVSLSCGTLLTARRRPQASYFTDRDQKARFSQDRFCERTPIYATGFNKTWPIFPPPS